MRRTVRGYRHTRSAERLPDDETTIKREPAVRVRLVLGTKHVDVEHFEFEQR
jgi:hypothetical protein